MSEITFIDLIIILNQSFDLFFQGLDELNEI